MLCTPLPSLAAALRAPSLPGGHSAHPFPPWRPPCIPLPCPVAALHTPSLPGGPRWEHVKDDPECKL